MKTPEQCMWHGGRQWKKTVVRGWAKKRLDPKPGVGKDMPVVGAAVQRWSYQAKEKSPSQTGVCLAAGSICA